MKKNFFKKLSFVLAGAMVLSTLTPASGAFAAKAPKLNSTSKYLHFGREKENKYNFNVSNKKSGWKYEWTSANEDVAKVNKKNGVVTATGVGSTKVSVVITDKDGEEVEELKAKVTVRDNIATVKISNPPTEAIAVGAEYDFNRSYTTESGSSKKTSSITRWTVDSEKATINEKGVFVATEAGEYTVTARSFQSKAKYESWLTDAKKYAGYVLDDDSVKVKVAASMKEVKQVDVKTFKVTFDTPMKEEEVKKNLSAHLLVGQAKSEQYIKSVSLDKETSKTATVELYGPFSKGMTYVVDYIGMESLDFQAVTTNYKDVVKMTIDTKTAVANEETEIKFSLFNAAGVNITEGCDSEFSGALKDRVNITTESDGAYILNNKITIFEIGKVAEVKATYNTYDYDDQGNERGTLQVPGQIVGVKEATVRAGSLEAYTITTEGKSPDWNKIEKRVAVEANQPKLFVKVKNTDGKELTSDKDDKFTFASTNDNVLYVDPEGRLYPVKDGASVVVVVKYNDVIVDYANVTIVAKSKASIFTLSEYAFTLSIDPDVEDEKTIEINLKNQYGNDVNVDLSESSITPITNKDGLERFIEKPQFEGKKIKFKVLPGAQIGRVSYEVKVNGIKRTVNITLAEPNHNGDESKIQYRLELNKTIDLAVEKADDLNKTLDIKLIGYAPNGVKATKDVASKAAIKITGPQDDLKFNSKLYGTETRNGVSGQAITKIKTGTYKVEATMVIAGNNKVVGNVFFRVDDTQKAATPKVKETYYTNSSSYVDIAKECFEIKIDGKEVTDDIFDVVTGDYSDINRSVYIKEVLVKQPIDGTDNYIVHTVKIARTVYAK